MSEICPDSSLQLGCGHLVDCDQLGHWADQEGLSPDDWQDFRAEVAHRSRI